LASNAMLINLGGGAATDGLVTDTLISIENVIGSRFSDTIIGDASGNVLDGGGGGADQINGGGGNDTVSYASSSFAVLINLAAQVATDGFETDALTSIENARGSNLNDTIISSDAVNIIDGGLGSDTVSYAPAPRAMLINLAAQTATDGVFTDTLVSIENAIGSTANDRIVASSSANVFTGNGGNDSFVFQRGSANGDAIADFNGNAAAAGDSFEFVGYGPGATFTQVDAFHWQVNSGDGLLHELIWLQNGATVHPSDILFL
jgi:Ca2+-binding RTX toxin-like protein